LLGLLLVSLSQLQEIPSNNLTLLVGPPGAGKSIFCQQTILKRVVDDRPAIFVTTEYGTSEAEKALRERGLREVGPGLLNFVDTFNETVGLSVSDRPDTVYADCNDLSSIGIAIAKLQERIGEKGVLLVFDSLTSPYLFGGAEVLRFIRQTLTRFAARGNAVLACIDEGCGKPEDLVAMMSLANSVIKIEAEKDKQLFNVVKHPRVQPTSVEVPLEAERMGLEARIFNPNVLGEFSQAMVLGREAVMRKEMEDYVNLFWPNFAHWSGMLWDPQRFPTMTYEFNREDGPSMFKLCRENDAVRRAFLTMRMRLALKFMPKSFSKVKDMKKVGNSIGRNIMGPERSGTIEYLEDASKTDEHYFRLSECSDCWGFENIGTTMASYIPPTFAGMCQGFEYWKGLERDWNAVETKCIGLGDPYCEFKVVPGEISELKDSLKKDSSVIERIHERLMHRLMGFMLDGKPLIETRPKLGSDIQLHAVFHAMAFPAIAGERYQMALRMGGAKAGKEVGEHLLDKGMGEDEAVQQVLSLLEHCKVGKVAIAETIKMRENCESSQTKLFTTKVKEPSCFFTTGFLNGFFYAVTNQHVKETRCIAMGDPYCEWEFR
jgi:predicted hydrocarbon binding protein/KaiC/GvpD/RAD55 family RecA-like ATPase